MKMPLILSSHLEYGVDKKRYSEAFEFFVQERYEESASLCRDLIADIEVRDVRLVGGTPSAYDAWTLYSLVSVLAGELESAKHVLASLESEALGIEHSLIHRLAYGLLLSRLGKYRESFDYSNSILEERKTISQGPEVGMLLVRGISLLRQEEFTAALNDLLSGYYFSEWFGYPWLQAEYANYVGVTYLQRSEYYEARSWFDSCLEHAEQLGSRPRIGRVSLNCGIAYYKSGLYPRAIERLEHSLCALRSTNDKLNLTRTHIALGNVHRLTRDFDTARKHLMTAYTMATDLAVPREECLALEFLGDIHRDENKPDEAQRYYQRGLAIGERIAPEGDLVMEIHRRQGECLIRQNKVGQGVELLAQARSHARRLGDQFEEGVIMRCLAEGLQIAGHFDEALDYALKAAALLERIEARHEQAIACITAASILLDISRDTKVDDPRDKLDQAWEHALTAQNICRQLGIEYWINVVKRTQSQIAKRRAEEAKYASKTPRRLGGGKASKRQSTIIIAESRAMKESLEAVEVFAPHDEPILLTGETGTGKEVLARLAHQKSERADKPFVATNITAIPHSMFEREFFGHVKGSFSGADSDRKGLVAEADGGTLFLDEIGDLAPQTQAKLLRVLQDGSYLCLGDPVERRADLRVIAATNIDLEAAVKKKTFREDLYYRLAILTIPIPALRDRPEDIRPLLNHFLSESAGRQVAAEDYFNDTSIKLMEKYDWPGNVREVALVARRAFITQHTLGSVEVSLGVGDDAMVLRGHGGRTVVSMAAQSGGEPQVKDAASAPALSRARILLALEEAGGNRSEAARRLGVSRATFYRRLARLGIDR